MRDEAHTGDPDPNGYPNGYDFWPGVWTVSHASRVHAYSGGSSPVGESWWPRFDHGPGGGVILQPGELCGHTLPG